MLHYRAEGSGEPVLVLLHGFCEDNTCFNRQVLFFKDRYKVFCPDLPGFGKSDVQEPVTMEAMADAVAACLDKEGVSKCVMLGHSMGGYVTLAFAERYPDRLLGFGLIHSAAHADDDARKEKRNQVINFVKSNGHEPYIRSFIPTLFKPGASPELVAEAVDMGLQAPPAGIIAAAAAMRERPNRTAILKESKLPVLVVAGAADALLPVELLMEQAAMATLAQVAVLKESGHLGMLEEPQALNVIIDDYLKLLMG